jgi:hypothetical protein
MRQSTLDLLIGVVLERCWRGGRRSAACTWIVAVIYVAVLAEGPVARSVDMISKQADPSVIARELRAAHAVGKYREASMTPLRGSLDSDRDPIATALIGGSGL